MRPPMRCWQNQMQVCPFSSKSYSACAARVRAPLHSFGLLMKAALILMGIQGQLSLLS